MANNRLYVACRPCGQARLVAKFFGDWYTFRYPLRDPLGEFMNEHVTCGEGGDYDAQEHFDFIREHGEGSERLDEYELVGEDHPDAGRS